MHIEWLNGKPVKAGKCVFHDTFVYDNCDPLFKAESTEASVIREPRGFKAYR